MLLSTTVLAYLCATEPILITAPLLPVVNNAFRALFKSIRLYYAAVVCSHGAWIITSGIVRWSHCGV